MRYGILGPLEIHLDGSPVEVPRPRQRAALTFLLLNANRPVSLERMVDAMWGEAPPRTARAQVHNVVSSLRRALPPQAARRHASEPAGYRLSVTEGAIDSLDFERALGEAKSLATQGDREAATRLLREGLAHWRGKALEGIEAPFAPAAEAHLNEQRFTAYELLADLELELGGHQRLIPELTALLTEYPTRESVAERLASALYLSGRQTDALEVVSRMRALLRAEYGLDVGRTLVELEGAILRQQVIVTAAPVPRGAEAVKAIASPAGQSDDVSVAPRPAQLPTGAPKFVGRRAELDQLCGALQQAEEEAGPVVVSVTGMGGVGKTALAIHAGHLLRQQFPDGQLYVDLRGFASTTPRTAHEVLATLLSDLAAAQPGKASRPLPEDTDDRAAMLRTALSDLRILLVVDNVRESAQVLPLLPGTGASAVIVTSRNVLADLPAAERVALSPLDVEEQRALLSALCGEDRVTQDLDGAVRILAACAGLPLALRVAGARLAARPLWPLTVLADRLAGGPGRLAALAAGGVEVKRVFAASYLALRDSEDDTDRQAARAFRLMGLWPGQVFSAASAGALLDRTPAEAETLLELLVDAHLLESPAPLRYRFHDLLGEYSAGLVRAEESGPNREAARLRICVWFTLALERARLALSFGGQLPPRLELPPPASLPDFPDEEHALSWCREELPNIGDVIRHAGSTSRPDIAWRLAVWLMGYMRTQWWTGQWENYLNEALSIAEQHDDRLGRAWVLRSLGACHGLALRVDKSIEASHQALSLIDDPDCAIAVLGNLSNAHTHLGRSEEALDFARKAFDLHRRSGSSQAAIVTSNMADALRIAGRFTEAETHYREALMLWQQCGDTTSIAITLLNLGATLSQLGQRDDAYSALRKALTTARSIGHLSVQADALTNLAQAHAHFAEWTAAHDVTLEVIDFAAGHDLGPWLSKAQSLLETIEAAGASKA